MKQVLLQGSTVQESLFHYHLYCIKDGQGNSQCVQPPTGRAVLGQHSSAYRSKLQYFTVVRLPYLIQVQVLVLVYLYKTAKGTQRTCMELLHSNFHTNTLQHF